MSYHISYCPVLLENELSPAIHRRNAFRESSLPSQPQRPIQNAAPFFDWQHAISSCTRSRTLTQLDPHARCSRAAARAPREAADVFWVFWSGCCSVGISVSSCFARTHKCSGKRAGPRAHKVT